jgi:hypothetical protein
VIAYGANKRCEGVNTQLEVARVILIFSLSSWVLRKALQDRAGFTAPLLGRKNPRVNFQDKDQLEFLGDIQIYTFDPQFVVSNRSEDAGLPPVDLSHLVEVPPANFV